MPRWVTRAQLLVFWTKFSGQHIPLLAEEGCPRHQKQWIRSDLSRTGWSVRHASEGQPPPALQTNLPCCSCIPNPVDLSIGRYQISVLVGFDHCYGRFAQAAALSSTNGEQVCMRH